MNRLLPLYLIAASAFAQYKTAPAGAPPAELNPGISAALRKDGTKLMNGDKVVCEIWFRSAAPTGPKSAEDNVSLPTIPQGALVGALRVPSAFTDRRGNQVKPGVYTLRYSNFPQNGDHQGVAPQRDFLLLSNAADDKDVSTTPSFKALVDMSEKAMGRPHPGVLSMWKADAGAKPGLSQMGENDWVLTTNLGDTPIMIILVGKAEA
jgi:hypothetical protein